MNCAECDAELEPDEPQTCYFTGGGPCGDCRDPRTNKPPYPGGCFHPVLCDDCAAAPPAVPVSPRERRRKEIENMLATQEYRNKRKEELRSQYGGRYS